jgi:universal stress protein E
MSKQIRHILVAIGDLHRAPRSELRKVAAVARAAHASIELLHVVGEPKGGANWREITTAETIEARRAELAEKCRLRLEQFARDPSLRGLTVDCTASCDYPVHEAIVRRAAATHADLVIAATRPHTAGARLLLRGTDWDLIRHCPVPLLLVKPRRTRQRPVILAAVDPFHAHAKPADLDAALLGWGRSFAQLLHGTVHAFHSYMPLINVAPVPVGTAPVLVLPPEAEEAHGEQILRTVGRLAGRAGIPAVRCHVHMGEVAPELRAAVRHTHASLVVMGAVSRSALARLFIGNTAERVLDWLSCDVLIVKPRGFKSGVARRRPDAPARRPRAQPRVSGNPATLLTTMRFLPRAL